MSGQAGRYQRSATGMVGAMIVLIAVVGGFVTLRELNSTDPPSPVRDVDYAKVAQFARKQATFDLVAPAALAPGWRATTVDYVDGVKPRWHLGMLDAEGRYVGLEQSGSSVSSMVETYVDEAAVRGKPVRVGGQTWSRWSDAGGDVAIVRDAGDTTTLLVGDEVPVEELATFATTLR
ncbi:DUF4245 domain-containing protein [Nocardioides mesophilus]|uniref:DUF4245 domain-containing protein n=1 Tax=Nocardioides mesophilus TaxID=433659 RepID=A0A7G9R7V3_9ACTN|nr:DUF4245 domain-containing protein [Nocardioides mesophilus]QNN51678.1 DUF4245 domain-containing protein [Nocardioides mesophilus]